MLCDVCRNIHFRSPRKCGLKKKRVMKKDIHFDFDLDLFYIHHKSRIVLKQSMDLGCHFCAMLWDRLFGFGHTRFATMTREFDEDVFPGGEVIFRRESRYSATWPMENWNIDDWIYIYCGRSMVVTTSRSSPSESPGLVVQMLHALTTAPREDSTDQAECHGISNIDNDHDESIISGALLPANHPELYSPRLDVSTTSLANIALASFWLQYCLRNHQPGIMQTLASHFPETRGGTSRVW
ncbi:hypothetical protein F4815DRAFT_281195 [Daldinia loculata]|nr:hypothetical protein F4815DRAFT_281195 [Daldinia loculata]